MGSLLLGQFGVEEPAARRDRLLEGEVIQVIKELPILRVAQTMDLIMLIHSGLFSRGLFQWVSCFSLFRFSMDYGSLRILLLSSIKVYNPCRESKKSSAMSSISFFLMLREQSLGRFLRTCGISLNLLLSSEMVRSSVRSSMFLGSCDSCCPSMRRYFRCTISEIQLLRAQMSLFIKAKVSSLTSSDSQSGSSLILQSSSYKISRLLASFSISLGRLRRLGICRDSCLNLSRPPTYQEMEWYEDSIFSTSRFLRLKMPLGRFLSPVLLRSREMSSFSDPIHSGNSSSLFFPRANSFSLVKFWMAQGNFVSLFLERSRKVSLVRFLKLSGSSAILLLSDSTFFMLLRFPKFWGRAESLLWRMLRPSMVVSSHISSGSSVNSLFLRFNFFIFLSLEMVSTVLMVFLLSCSLSRLGKFSVMNCTLVSLLSASSMFMMEAMPSLDPFMISMLLSSMFSSISERISCSFLQMSFTFCGMMYYFLARSRVMLIRFYPYSSGISKTRYFLRKRFSASFLTRSSILVTFSFLVFLSMVSPQIVMILFISNFLNLCTFIFLDSICMQTPQVGMTLYDSAFLLMISVHAFCSSLLSPSSSFFFNISWFSFSILHSPQIMCPHSSLVHFWWIHRQLVWEQALLQSLHTKGLSSSTQLCYWSMRLQPKCYRLDVRCSFFTRLRYSTALGSRLVHTEHNYVMGPKSVLPSSQTQWLNMLEH